MYIEEEILLEVLRTGTDKIAEPYRLAFQNIVEREGEEAVITAEKVHKEIESWEE